MMIFDDATQSTLLDAFIVLGFIFFGIAAFLSRRAAASRPLQVNETVWSRIRQGPEGRPQETLAWSLGALSPAAVADRLNELEKRGNLRRNGNPVEVLVFFHDGAADPIRGTIIDRSRTGLKFLVPVCVPLGSLLHIRASHAPEESPWVQVEVRHSHPHGDEWEVGCRLTEELSWGVLLLFG